MPENTIPAFIKAIDLGVTTLEMDLAVTKDRELIISHEPWMNHVICSDSLQKKITEENQRDLNIFEMTYQQISTFDCGSNINPRFPQQEKFSTSKPRLIDVINSSEEYTSGKGDVPVNYNFEIKSHKATEGIFHPKPSEYSDLALQTILKLLPKNRFTIQSFDIRVLQYINEKYSDIKLVYLVGDLPYDIPGVPYDGDKGFVENIKALGFSPDIYSPEYSLLSEAIIDQIHKEGIKVIPWTVNERADMDRLLSWGVDGIITDYPDRTK